MNTPYDKGVVTKIRSDDMLIITPLNWRLANNCIPKFYIKQTAPKHTPEATLTCQYKVDDVVYAPYGKGKIKEIRKISLGFAVPQSSKRIVCFSLKDMQFQTI